jgi:ATP-dependent DNA ligase
VHLAVNPTVPPMLAKRVEALPEGEGWIYEPKWDGFRALIFRDRDEVFLQSRDEKPLARYYPELIEPLKAALPDRVVLDGEIVIVGDRGLDFDALQLRLHPAESRVRMLAGAIPASMVFFDILGLGDRDLRSVPFAERRKILGKELKGIAPPLHLTPATTDFLTARDWFKRFEGAGLDGVIAKRAEGTYQPGKRAMLKIKHQRDCDCVVAGFRWHKNGRDVAVGSLLLGLYDSSGSLQHVGVCASFTNDKRRDLVDFLAPYRTTDVADHPWRDWAGSESGAEGEVRMPGESSRWNQGKDLSWVPLRPELVVEVAYDHMQGTRFRHTAQFRRWRMDKAPAECTFDQVEVIPPHELREIFRIGR